MRIKVEKNKCSGCHLCEMVCSLFHLKTLHIERSAIRIEKDGLNSSVNTPILCRQCENMKCLDGEETIEAEEKRNFIWSEERAERCPFHALTVFDGNAYHCDLCGGDPQCLQVCTPGAIHLIE